MASAVNLTRPSRWGRSTTDLLATLRELEARRVSLVALNGMAFDLSTPHGRMMATLLAGIAEFERELTVERIRSGIAAAKARGKKLGRQPGQRPKSDRLAPKVLALVAQGRSYRPDRARGGIEQEHRRRDREAQRGRASRPALRGEGPEFLWNAAIGPDPGPFSSDLRCRGRAAGRS